MPFLCAPFVALVVAAFAPQDPAIPLKPAGKGHIEIYDVRDLAMPSRLRRLVDDRAADAGKAEKTAELALIAMKLAARDDGHDEVAAEQTAYDLLQALVQCMGARTGGVDSCAVKENGAMVLKATSDAHAAVDAMLKHVRASDAPLTIEVRLLELDPKAQELLKGFAQTRGPDSESTGSPVLNPTADELARLLAEPGTTERRTEQVVCAALDPFTLEVGQQVSCITNYKSVVIEGFGTIADPEIQTIHDGDVVRGRGIVAVGAPGDDPPPYALRLVVEMKALKRPIDTLKTPLGVIQLPELKHATISTTIAGTVDRPLLIGGIGKPSFDAADARTKIYALVKVRSPTKK
jgi:hypothetical protein